ncbi:MAG TPA: hypothetical protein VIG99_04645, partial [Myxococcaceae bacterium]
MEPKVVWILGAGFSRSLGGPLLDDLLQPDCLRRLRATFPDPGFPLLQGILPELVVWLFHYGRRFSAGRRSELRWETPGETLWRDAEEFLDFVDLAAASPKGAAATTLKAIMHQSHGRLPPEPSELRGMARRLIAAECTAFLRSANLETERWGPYRRWVTEVVGPSDSIVTFNYDVALEHLCGVSKSMTILLPGTSKGSRDGASVLKLHGSVNWRRIPGKGAPRYQETDLESAACCTCQDT